ncbi:hypothetical protein VCV18_004832 [Metarhizium anisopliae]
MNKYLTLQSRNAFKYLNRILNASVIKSFSSNISFRTATTRSNISIASLMRRSLRYAQASSYSDVSREWLSAVSLLSFISCVEPKAIPRSILLNMEPEQMEWAVGMICSYSFLVRRGDSSTFDMHSLVHIAMREWAKR